MASLISLILAHICMCTHDFQRIHICVCISWLGRKRIRLPSSRNISVPNSRWIFHPTVVTTTIRSIWRKRSLPQGRRIRRQTLKGIHYRILHKSVYSPRYYSRSITFKNLVKTGVHCLANSFRINLRRFTALCRHWKQLSSFIPDEVIYILINGILYHKIRQNRI